MEKGNAASYMVLMNFIGYEKPVEFLFNKKDFEDFEKQMSACSLQTAMVKCKTADKSTVFLNTNKIRDMFFLFQPTTINDEESLPYMEVLLATMKEPEIIEADDSDDLFEVYAQLYDKTDGLITDDCKFIGIPDIDGEMFYFNVNELLYVKVDPETSDDCDNRLLDGDCE